MRTIIYERKIIMKEKVLKILTNLRPDVDFENETALVSDEILD